MTNADWARDSTWRQKAAPIIAKVIEQHRGEPESQVRKALREAYPFGPRRYHPYKMWLKEIRFQLGKEPLRRQGSGRRLARKPGLLLPPDQGGLFDELKGVLDGIKGTKRD